MPIQHAYPFFKDPLGIYRTNLLVNIINPTTKKAVRVWALVDTGADDCVFPKGLCEALGYDLKADGIVSKITQGIGGIPVTTWMHTFKIELLSPDKTKIVWKSQEVKIGCLEHDNAPVILGTIGFLSHFNIRFNYPTKRIVIEMP